MKKDILEDIIKQSIKEDLDNMSIPKMDDVWINIENHIQNDNKSKKNNINRKGASIVAVLIVSVFIGTGFMNKGQANFRRVLNIITKTSQDKIDIDLDYKNNETLKESENVVNEGFKQKPMSIEEAIKQADFAVKVPTYIPQGYKIKEVFLDDYKESKLAIDMTYTNNEGNKYIQLNEESIIGDSVQSISLNKEKSDIKQITDNGFKYNVITHDNGTVTIIWDMFQVKYTLRGENEEEMIKVALSIGK